MLYQSIISYDNGTEQKQKETSHGNTKTGEAVSGTLW